MKSVLSPLREIPFETLNHERIRMESMRKQALDQGRTRLLVTGVVFALAFVVLGGRLVELSRYGEAGAPKWQALAQAKAKATAKRRVVSRGNVRDRKGRVLAVSLPTRSLYVDPKAARSVGSAREDTQRLLGVLPKLNLKKVMKEINGPGRFEWVARNLTPDQVWAVNRLGLPGFGFRKGERRVYPYGSIFAHILGYTDTDGRGIAGIERTFERRLGGEGKALTLSVDLRVQSILYDAVGRAMDKFKAKGAAGVVMNVNTGEVLAMVSLPDFDPNNPQQSLGDRGFNRATKGVYEMGSTFKLFTTAMALDSGVVKLTDGYDATRPIHIARFTISDFHPKKRWLSVPEILTYSSNIGAAKMALDVGAKTQRKYLKRFGLLSEPTIELPEVGRPLFPESPVQWGKISTMTIAYGHGIAVSALQVAAGVSALVNGGVMHQPTLLKVRNPEVPRGTRVISARTSRAMRALMRKVVRDGTGGGAAVKGYLVGGKTGTAEKEKNGRYETKVLVSSFVGVFPMTAPRFVVLVMLDEPKGDKTTFGYATGGWVAAPAVGRIIARMGPLFGLAPGSVDPNAQSAPGQPLFIPDAKVPQRTAMRGGGVRRAIY